MAIEKLKINYKIQNQTWTYPQIKNHKNSHAQTDQTTDTTQKSRTHVFIFCEENCDSSHVQVSLYTKKYKRSI
jgi:hypothetical protein